jgi:UDP-N-acetylglucosamine diphosphorylase/glucosamine-1-phosphate N-acetyltransferase
VTKQSHAGVVVFEDERWADLAPLTDLASVPALAFGGSTLCERWCAFSSLPLVGIEARVAALATWRDRPDATPLPAAGRLRAVNAACLPHAIPVAADADALFMAAGRVAGASAPAAVLAAGFGRGEGYGAYLAGLGLPVVEVDARVIERPWQMIEWNLEALAADLAGAGKIDGEVHPQAVLYAPGQITIGAGACVDALAVIDAREGPVRIEAGARVAPHTWVKGPCHVGRDTQLLGGIVGRSTLGPDCRIAGEVEDCIWQGRANKRHHGFVGHSVIGEWVNLGALTTTSDLKNNYGVVRMQLPGGEVSTGSPKIGALIGAHAKTGIGSLLPTGAYVGTGANLFGGGRFAPKHVPAFGWWDGERMAEHRLEAFLATARTASSRRGVVLSAAETEALASLFASGAETRMGRP